MDGAVGGRARRCGAAVAVGLLLVMTPLPAAATDVSGARRAASAAEPFLGPGLAPEVVRTLRLGFARAAAQALGMSECGELFRDLGADPLELLGRSRYYAAELTWGKRACPDGVFAATQVGSRVTMLCGSFGRISRDLAAVVVLHEALHFAGLRERPRDPRALSSNEINRSIRKRCGL